MSLGGGNPQLQELSAKLQEVEEQIEVLQATVETVRDEQTAVDEAVDALGSLETDSTVQVPLGGGAYVRAEIDDIDEVLVELGADYAGEFEREGAIDTLENKRDRLDDRIEEISGRITSLESQQQQLEGQAQQLQQQALQQQMQGMGGDEQ